MDPNLCQNSKSPMETGSPEFAEDRTQVNSLNNKMLFDKTMTDLGNLQNVALRSLNNSVDFQAQVNQRSLAGFDQTQTELAHINAQRARHADDSAYVIRYDLSNPVATGTGDAVRSAAYTANRATDVAASGVGVSAEAVAAAVAKQVDATITPVLATLQQMIQALTTATTTIANVVNQAQPKTA